MDHRIVNAEFAQNLHHHHLYQLPVNNLIYSTFISTIIAVGFWLFVCNIGSKMSAIVDSGGVSETFGARC